MIELDLDRIERGKSAIQTYRAEAGTRHNVMVEREKAFLAEKVDTTEFSPRFQRIIAEYEQEKSRMRAENETALEYLRRKFPDMPEWARLKYMFLCAIAGISIKE